MKSPIKLLRKHYFITLFIAVFLFHIFFRFYQLEERFTFGWDQVDNAWAAKSILVDNNYPLLGMVAKGNTGFYIGPVYYYYISIFYFLTNLHPIASAYIAGFTSIITFLVLFFVIKKIFNEKVALIAVLIHTFSVFIIIGDRIQWPVNFIAPVSALVFYFLYKIITNNPRYILFLALIIGFSFHIHFTSVFYPLIVLCTLPFWPRTKGTLFNILLGIPLFAVWLTPVVYANSLNENANSGNLTHYLDTYYHGFYLTRMFQLIGDAFIELSLILYVVQLAFLKFLLIPIFFVIYLSKNITYEKKVVAYLISLWFLIPWLVFTVYSGEISNYYFYITRPVALMILSYITYYLLIQKYKALSIAIILFWTYYLYINTYEFFQIKNLGLESFERKAQQFVEEDKIFKYELGNPDNYFNYYFLEKNK